jgi:hypothetical protein
VGTEHAQKFYHEEGQQPAGQEAFFVITVTDGGCCGYAFIKNSRLDRVFILGTMGFRVVWPRNGVLAKHF